MDDGPISLDAARFARTSVPAHLNPRAALEAALRWLDEQDAKGVKIRHVVVITGRDAPDHDSGSGTKYFQAGDYRHHAQMGLCFEGMQMIRDSGQ